MNVQGVLLMSTEAYEIHGQVFNWDKNKNLSNIKKHGISFSVAALAFFDSNSTIIDDDEHSDDEDRFILVGFSVKHSLLAIFHCYRENGDVVRIISARKATKTEQVIYEGGE